MPVIDFVYLNAGGGHRAAAHALRNVIALQQRPWQVRLLDLREILDPQQRFKRITGFAPEEFYNRRLRLGWTIGLAQEVRVLQGLVRATHKSMTRTLSQHWARTEPDLVVSLVPNFNRALCASVAAALPGVPFVTVMTDMADLPPHFWIEPDQDQWLVCGTEHAWHQARQAGVARDRLHLTSGMVLRPDFYGLPTLDRDAGLRTLGLDPTRPTGVLFFGGEGSNRMVDMARQLDELQLIVLCGRHEALVERLRGLERRAPLAAVGFTSDVASVLRLGDFMIGKPGPGTISEAVHLGLPVITFSNAWTMPQERYNTRWVQDQGVGLVVGSVAELSRAVDQMIATLPALAQATRRLDNRAVFEIPEILCDRLPRLATAGASPAGVNAQAGGRLGALAWASTASS